MKQKSQNLLRNQTILTLSISMFFTFIVTASILLFYFDNLSRDSQTKTIYLTAEKKKIELNNFFNSAENIVKEFQDYILTNLDENRLLIDSEYEQEYMTNLSKVMSSISAFQKGAVCTYFRMEMSEYGPTRGLFLTGEYQKSYVSIRTTDLSKYSPGDIEHVGWYYLPIWKKGPVWTPPYNNLSLRQKMVSYSVPLYRNEKLLGVVGIDLSLAVIEDMVNSLQLENSKGLLIGDQQNLIHLNTRYEQTKAVERSAELSLLMDKFNNPDKQPLQKFQWEGTSYYGTLTKLDNGMSYITAVSQKELLKPVYGQIIALFIAFVIVSILFSFLIVFCFKKIITPIRIINKTTNRLARGELYIDIPYQSNNEIGTLANNIRLMTSQLKEYIEYIREQTEKERELKEAALTESQINAAASQAKSAFLANMSHEIRTPINAVLGMNEMILRESTDNEILSYAANIKTAGASLLSIVNDILDFSKIEAGKMELLPDNYEVSSMIIDLVNMTRDRAQSKGLNYELNISPDLPKTLYGDNVRIKQCILNLITNAIKYTKEGTISFTIDYQKIDEENILLTIHVIDTGIGIKSEDMEKLFTPFERIDEEKNRTIEGSGLGISIVRRLLDMMGSSLQVKSTYGKGSDFSFSINQKVSDWTATGDLNEAYAQSVEQMSHYKENLHAPKAHLLFVDDTAMNLDVIRGLLKNTGIKIDTVLSGKQALEAVKNKVYDIVFIDHRMPEMDGIETLHAMKEMTENKSAGKPCIALTANAISGVKKMYLNEGFDDYLSKPVNPSKLKEMIRNYLPEEYIEDSENSETPDIILENEDQSTTESLIQKLKNIKEIDVDAGIKFCGTPELLLTTINQYYSSINQKALELQNYFDSEDWNNYEIKVHALKSTSRLIGAIELSKLAEYLEKSANQNDIEEIQINHKELINSFLDFFRLLEPMVNNEDDDSLKPEITNEQLTTKIHQMMEYAESFDIDGLDNIVKELSNFQLPLDFSQKFVKISQYVQNVDFKELRNLLLEWSNEE